MDHDIQEAIETAVSRTVDVVLWYLTTETLDRDRVMEIIDSCDQIDTDADDLDLDQKLEVVKLEARESGLGNLTFDLDSLRSTLDSYAVMAIQTLAENRAASMFEDLFDFMDDKGLEPKQMRDANPYSSLAPCSERDEGLDCTVYEYRDVDGQDRHIDVWEYCLPSDHRVWFVAELRNESQGRWASAWRNGWLEPKRPWGEAASRRRVSGGLPTTIISTRRRR